MKVLHLLTSGGVGGIETLVKDYSRLSNLDNTFVFTYTGGDIADEMTSRGDKCIVLKHSKKSIIKTYKYLDDLCKKEQFSAIVVQPAAPVLYLYALRLKNKYNMQFFAYAHSDAYDMVRFNEKNAAFRNTVMKFALQRADGIVAISNYVKKTVEDIFAIDDTRIRVIYNGVDINKYSGDDEDSTSDEELKIIYVGRLIAEKGVQILLDALSKVDKSISINCKIVGSGTYEDELKAISKRLQLEDRVEFLGRRRDVDKLLSQADIFIHAALWQEGFGITIIEAMSAGKICVCSDCGAIPEIIDDGINGYLFKQGDAKALAQKIEEVYKMSDEQKKEMSLKAKEKAKRFNIDGYVKSLDDFIAASNS